MPTITIEIDVLTLTTEGVFKNDDTVNSGVVQRSHTNVVHVDGLIDKNINEVLIRLEDIVVRDIIFLRGGRENAVNSIGGGDVSIFDGGNVVEGLRIEGDV